MRASIPRGMSLSSRFTPLPPLFTPLPCPGTLSNIEVKQRSGAVTRPTALPGSNREHPTSPPGSPILIHPGGGRGKGRKKG
jgi:hypothetical protein